MQQQQPKACEFVKLQLHKAFLLDNDVVSGTTWKPNGAGSKKRRAFAMINKAIGMFEDGEGAAAEIKTISEAKRIKLNGQCERILDPKTRAAGGAFDRMVEVFEGGEPHWGRGSELRVIIHI
jgi:hypothetical protein